MSDKQRCGMTCHDSVATRKIQTQGPIFVAEKCLNEVLSRVRFASQMQFWCRIFSPNLHQKCKFEQIKMHQN